MRRAPLDGLKVLQADGMLADPKRPVTVCDLMPHTSGLSYRFLEDTPVGRMWRRSRKLTLLSLATCPPSA